jgi:hypothetical protein
LKYGFSPVLECFDLAINVINWTKENVNDIFVALGAEDSYIKNLGKVTIHQLAKENASIFPVMRSNAYLLAAYLTSLITKEKIFTEILAEMGRKSSLLEQYLGQEMLALPKESHLWTIVNEVWLRHLKRESKQQKANESKRADQKLSPEEKARRAYNMFENALVKYTYSIKSKQGISILGIKHEDSILECLKYIWQNKPAELFETEFTIGDENLNFGTVKLIDALTSTIQSKQGKLREYILKLLTPMDNIKHQELAAEIIDLFNSSLIQETGIVLDSTVLSHIRKICSKYYAAISPSAISSADSRNKLLQLLIHQMGSDLSELQASYDPTTQKNVLYFTDALHSIFDSDVLAYIKKIIRVDETLQSEEYKKALEDFARYIWGKGVKKNSFTIFLNHLLVEKTRGSAEIGLEYWRRYADRCRYILKRLEQTCQIVKF